ncbi:hypothetical protein LIA77_11623 [Sarocladium implicatum]|nr:hypothetical protein LIA77_11623 [Sarocladium implicatum]
MVSPRGRRYAAIAAVFLLVLLLFIITDGPKTTARGYLDQYLDYSPGASKQSFGGAKGAPRYLPEPSWVPPPVKDPFHSLATADEAPPIPDWNQPKHELHVKYDLEYAPPLFIGFTRSWPMLLQTVVSFITAGWPASQIYVIENTGVQRANAKGQLTLQNPFYLNHESLNKLGVNVIQAPVLMTFSQLQNYYMYLSHQYQWPYYFWAHQDVLAFSFEDGRDGLTPKAHEEGYASLYELALSELNATIENDERWGHRLLSFDNMALVNREAYEDVGGWDTFIPYYMTECDMHSRLIMGNWTSKEARIGLINDVSHVLDDLRVLYRDESIEPAFSDPNPSKPTVNKRDAAPADAMANSATSSNLEKREGTANAPTDPSSITYFRKLARAGEQMHKIKKEAANRNNWQGGQRGGKDEPFYYPSRGIAMGIDTLTKAGREVFSEKWGHRKCDLVSGAGLKLEDQWRVARDWE